MFDSEFRVVADMTSDLFRDPNCWWAMLKLSNVYVTAYQGYIHVGGVLIV